MMEAVENGFREGTMKILILCDDKWHPAEVVERGLAFLAEEGHALDFVRDAKDILTPAFLGRYPVVINAKGNALTGANDAPWFEEGVTEAGPEELREYVEAGGGFLSLHAGNSFKAEENKAYTDFVGNSFVKHPPRCTVRVTVDRTHPVTEGVHDFEIRDEHYELEHLAADILPLLSTVSESGGKQTGGYVRSIGKGRLCVLTPGHILSVWENEEYRKLVRNAVFWCAGGVK